MAKRNVSLLAALVLALCTPAAATAQGLGLPGPGGCYEDAFEPNPFGNPTVLADSTALTDVNVCSSDDWYRVDLSAGQVATFEVRFLHAQGDIDMTLHRADDYSLIDISESSADRELIRFVAFEAASVLLRVYGYSGATNRYTLDYRLDDYSTGCPPSDIPPHLSLDRMYRGQVCLGQTAEWRLEVDDDEPFELTLVTDAALGDLDLAVLDDDGVLEAISASRGPWERLRVFPDDDADYRIRLSSYGRAFGPFTLSVARIDADARPLEVEGDLRFERLVPTERGLKSQAEVAPEGVLVELIRELDDFPVARTLTDETGHYQFRLPYAQPGALRVRVSARSESPAFRIRVIPAVDSTDAHHLDSEPLSAYDVVDGRLVLDVRLGARDALSGALNIVHTARAALELVASAADASGLDVVFVWDQGQRHACGSCYSDDMILLAGGPLDTDEFDDAVIVHELGHFIIDELSRDDSPGGSHDGSRTSPLVAYGEGIATAFALVALASPRYADTAGGGVRAWEDLETVPYPQAYGTSDRRLTGRVSEWMTAALVWDFFDPPSPDEPFDRVEHSAPQVLRVLFGPLADRRRPDLGPAGVDLADLVNAFRCTYPDDAGALEQLVRGHQRFPIEPLGKRKCEWSAVR